METYNISIVGNKLESGIPATNPEKINYPVLANCYNLIATESGLVSYTAPMDFLKNNQIKTSWDSLYNTTACMLNETFLGLFPNFLLHNEGANIVTPLEQNTLFPWQFAKVHNFVLAFGFPNLARFYKNAWVEGFEERLMLDDKEISVPLCKTLTAFKERILCGCCLTNFIEDGTRILMWSGVSTLNFSFGVDSSAGFTYFPSEILKIVLYKEGCLVFCIDGIYYVSFELLGNDAIARFVMKKVSDKIPLVHNVHNFYVCETIAGSSEVIYFLGSDKQLFVVKDFNVIPLGYNHVMQTLLGTKIKFVYDSQKLHLYITDGNKSFVLTPFGLSSLSYLFSSVVPDVSTAGSIGLYNSNSTTNSFIESNWFELSGLDVKNLSQIFITECNKIPSILDLFFKYKNNGSEFSKTYVPMLDYSLVYPNVTADRFKVRLTFANSSTVLLKSVDINHQFVGKQNRRSGLNVDQNTSTAT